MAVLLSVSQQVRPNVPDEVLQIIKQCGNRGSIRSIERVRIFTQLYKMTAQCEREESLIKHMYTSHEMQQSPHPHNPFPPILPT